MAVTVIQGQYGDVYVEPDGICVWARTVIKSPEVSYVFYRLANDSGETIPFDQSYSKREDGNMWTRLCPHNRQPGWYRVIVTLSKDVAENQVLERFNIRVYLSSTQDTDNGGAAESIEETLKKALLIIGGIVGLLIIANIFMKKTPGKQEKTAKR